MKVFFNKKEVAFITGYFTDQQEHIKEFYLISKLHYTAQLIKKSPEDVYSLFLDEFAE